MSIEWARQGKTAEETTKLLEASVKLAKLANMDQAQSTEYLTSIINGYKLSMDEVMPTMDKLVALDNAYATSVSEIAEALQKVSAVSMQAGVSFEQMSSMIAVVSADTRASAESIGQAFKTILMRMQNVKLGKFLDDEGEDISDVERVLTSLGVKLRETNGTFRNMGEVLNDTMVIWKQLGSEGRNVEQGMISNAFAGQRQANIFTSLMNNQADYNRALGITANALGTVNDRYQAVYDSVEASKNRTGVEWEKFWQRVFPIETVISFYDTITRIFKFLSGQPLGEEFTKHLQGTGIAYQEKKIAEFEKSGDLVQAENAKIVLAIMKEQLAATEKRLELEASGGFDKDTMSPLHAPTVFDPNTMSPLTRPETGAYPDATVVQTFEEIATKANEATTAFVSMATSVKTLINSLDEGGVVTMSQVESLKNLFPEEYTQALIIEGDQIKLNTEILKGLVVAKATEALVSAQAALTIIQSDLVKAQSAVDAAVGVAAAAKALILTQAGVSAAYKGAAMASVDSANTQVAAANAILNKTQASLIGAYDAVDVAEAYLAQVSGAAFWTKELGAAASGAAGGVGSLSKEQSAYNDILKATISMIRQQKEAEKDALEEKLKNYKRTIDAHKKLLDQKKDEKEFDDDVAEKNKKIADIDNELLELQFDNSEEAQARKLELAQEKVDASKELSDLEYDYSVENQKEALDNEYDRYEEIIQKKIKSITDYLSQSGTITADAMALLASGTDTFYNSLLAWNKKFGTGVDEDIIGKWKLAIDWVGKYKDAVDGLGVKPLPAGSSPSTEPIGYGTYGGIDGNPNTPYHSGGWVGGKPTLASNEEYAKLMDGEYVATKGMISNFMGNTLPSMIAGGRGETPTIHLEFNVAGALDRSVIPDIKAIATQVIGQINNTMNSRGYLRSSNQTAS